MLGMATNEVTCTGASEVARSLAGGACRKLVHWHMEDNGNGFGELGGRAVCSALTAGTLDNLIELRLGGTFTLCHERRLCVWTHTTHGNCTCPVPPPLWRWVAFDWQATAWALLGRQRSALRPHNCLAYGCSTSRVRRPAVFGRGSSAALQ